MSGSHSSPPVRRGGGHVVEHGGRAQVIVPGMNKLHSYDLETGAVVWHSQGLTMNPIPSPVGEDGIVIATSGFRGNNLKAIRIAGIDLTSEMRFIAPDDGNAADRTVMSVPLPKAVGPNESVEIEIEWTSKIPRPFARTGYIDDYYFIVQWFPKIGVLEDDEGRLAAELKR